MYVPIYRKWWFWGIVLMMAAGVLWLKFEMNLQNIDEEVRIQNAVQQAYVSFMTKKGQDMVARQKADTYGGDTPKETLRFFIDALEKKDYELASKYYVIDEQEKKLLFFTKGEKDGESLGLLLSAYKNGRTVQRGDENSLVREIDLFAKNDSIPFGFRFVVNKFTQKWKLTDN